MRKPSGFVEHGSELFGRTHCGQRRNPIAGRKALFHADFKAGGATLRAILTSI
jgi:hypothetical protein